MRLTHKSYPKSFFFKEGPLIVLKEPSNARDLIFKLRGKVYIIPYYNNKLGNYGIQRAMVRLMLVTFYKLKLACHIVFWVAQIRHCVNKPTFTVEFGKNLRSFSLLKQVG